jgi:hypothetical protein
MDEISKETHGERTTGGGTMGLRGENKKWMRRYGDLKHFSGLKQETKETEIWIAPGDIFTFEAEQEDYVGRWKEGEWGKVQMRMRDDLKKMGMLGERCWKKKKSTNQSDWTYLQKLRWLEPRKFWRYVRNQAATRSIPGVRIGGQIYTDSDVVVKEVQDFYTELFRKTHVHEEEKWIEMSKWWKTAKIEPDVLSKEDSWEEFEEAIQKKDKATGWNQISMEHVRNLPTHRQMSVKKWVDGIVNQGHELEEAETEAMGWSLYKAGDLYDHKKSYRIITIMNIGHRIAARIVERRMARTERKHRLMSEQQGGFKALRQTAWQALVAKMATEQAKKLGTAAMVYVDIKKAYDNVDREMLWKILKVMGWSEKDIQLLKNLYQNANVKITTEKGTTERISQEKGLRQGCALSPLLFNLYIDGVIRMIHSETRGIHAGNMRVNILAFADDIALLAINQERLREMLIKLEGGL